MDLVIRDVTVVDGSGGPSYRADVAVREGRIAEIAREGEPRPTAPQLLDGAGLALAPGFIDMHAHSDLAVLRDPDHSAKVAQGVTLEVLGQDGLSYAPVDDRTLAEVRSAIAGWNGGHPDQHGEEPFEFDWRTVGEYLDRIDGQGAPVGAAYLVPQGTVRMLAVGWDDRPATEAELARMRQLVAEGMEQGAVGMSSGLTYTPGMYASGSELAELCATVAAYGGYYCPHHRSYGAGALEAYAEMVDVCARSGCALHLAHATMNFGVNKGRAGELLTLLDGALADGADLTLDTYPYTPGCTTLVAMLPSWAHEGGPEAVLRRLAEPDELARIRRVMEVEGSDGCHGVPMEWDAIEISGTANPELGEYVGKTVAAAAAERGEEPFTTAVRLLREDRLGTTILQHVGHEENVRAIMRHPMHTGGSDGILQGAKPHPRAWGTFPRYLGHYVREEGVLGLEECIAHLTSRPAARLRLPDRGLVREGYRADLVLFDPQTVDAGATFDNPRTLPTGLPHVLVDGEFTLRDGRRTDALPGRSVRRTPA